jgi:hypothetical protein
MEQQTLVQPSELQKTILLKALSMLATCGVQYAVVDFDGVKHGTLEVAAPTSGRKRSGPKTPRGSLRQYVEPLMIGLQVNQIVAIPATEDFDLGRLQSSVSSMACRMWGEGSATSHKNEKLNALEVARFS